jgi:hypothetical protein
VGSELASAPYSEDGRGGGTNRWSIGKGGEPQRQRMRVIERGCDGGADAHCPEIRSSRKLVEDARDRWYVKQRAEGSSGD